MKALTVCQPWASLIARGEKTIELRSRPSKYRGQFVVCAGKKPATSDPVRARVAEERGLLAAPRSVTLCIVELVECRPASGGDSQAACVTPPPGSFAWVLRVVSQLEPVPVSGSLSFWTLDDALIRRVV
jgi:hypothetical protein